MLFNRKLTSLLRIGFNSFCYKQSKFLYTKTILGVNVFERQRLELSLLKPNFIEKYRKSLHEASSSNQSIKLNDLKSAILLSQPEDTNLILKLLWRFYNGNAISVLTEDNARLSLGSLIMKGLWYHKQTKEAVNVLNYAPLQDIFKDASSYLVLFDLLYSSEEYQTIINIYKSLYKTNSNWRSEYILTYVLAAAYKIDTKESCKTGFDLMKDFIKMNNKEPMRHHLSFIVMMFIKNNLIDKAFQLLDNNHVIKESDVLKNLEIIVLAKQMKLKEMILILEEECYRNKLKLLEETVDYIVEAGLHADERNKQRINIIIDHIREDEINNMTIEEKLYDEIFNTENYKDRNLVQIYV